MTLQAPAAAHLHADDDVPAVDDRRAVNEALAVAAARVAGDVTSLAKTPQATVEPSPALVDTAPPMVEPSPALADTVPGLLESRPAADTALPEQSGSEPPREIGGRGGLDPTRYGDWELRGRCIDF